MEDKRQLQWNAASNFAILKAIIRRNPTIPVGFWGDLICN